MLEPLVLGSLLGIFSGIVPGPFSALIAATALRAGFWSGFRIAVVPLVTETIVLALSALVLSQLPEQALRVMGYLGGAFILYLAHRTWRESGRRAEAEPLTGSARQVMEGAVLAVLSPTPWIFWLLVGAPLFLGAWRDGWAQGAAFAGSFMGFLVGMYVGVAAVAAYGRAKLPHTWRHRLLRGAAGALVVAGGVLIWHSYTGDFHRMVTGTETLDSLVGDTLTGS